MDIKERVKTAIEKDIISCTYNDYNNCKNSVIPERILTRLKNKITWIWFKSVILGHNFWFTLANNYEKKVFNINTSMLNSFLFQEW